ncbi:TDT family transporter [Clostridium sp. D2Q-14]|uniref:TDT family transporter n=1 Tax=Anaeromonas gelatinilytica TaxID=2683194 RepID=UPI00193BDC03|nr:TDT family transporter [Anaeromonas gelatinilytica]MBS4535240.1 TDT family transporter [Anaeromonas gelatinilytica]
MVILLKKLPIPISGLMLGLAALGNLVGNFSSLFKIVLGNISALIFILLVLKIVMFPKAIKEGLNNPVITGIMATFPMSMMLLSTYIKPYSSIFAFSLWIFGLILISLLIIYFTKKYMFKFNIKNVFASYFVLYIGIVVGSVTAPAYNLYNIGRFIFWYGFIVYLPLIPLVIYRYSIIKEVPEAVKPIIIIFAAPASLLLAGYISSFTEKNLFIIVFLAIIALIMTLYCLLQMPKLLRLKFYPSYSAYTFPFVISAIAMNMIDNYLVSIGKGISILKYIGNFQILWAIVIVIYVLLGYINYMIREVRLENKIEAKRIRAN